MSDSETILAALAAMDHTDDSQWLDDGTPKTGVVQRLADDQTIKRQDVEAAAPSFRRSNRPAAPAVVSDNTSAENEPPLSVADAQKLLIESQVRLRAAHERQREARGRVARAVAGWQQAIGAIITPEQNARQYIATSLAERAAGGGRRSRGTPGPSVVDQYAFGHGRSVNQGKYGAWKRGGMSITESARRINEAARAKLLPSER